MDVEKPKIPLEAERHLRRELERLLVYLKDQDGRERSPDEQRFIEEANARRTRDGSRP